MGLRERIDVVLDRDGLLGIDPASSPASIGPAIEQRVTACVTTAVTDLARGLARSSDTGFEIDVGCEYDASTSEVDVEVAVSLLSGGDGARIGLALLAEGFRFLADPGIFHAELTMEIRPA